MANQPSCDGICFSELAYEWDISGARTTEKKIKRRLSYYKLGNYYQKRIYTIRQLKNELYV